MRSVPRRSSADVIARAGHEAASPGTPQPREERLGALRQLSPTRVVGFALYNLWMCAIFYNTFFFLSAQGETRPVLYLDQMLSLGILAVTFGLFSFVVRNPDRRVLSRNLIAGAAVVLTAFTALLLFVTSIEGLSAVLIVVSAVGTGLSSGALFLGWGRLYGDVGARLALIEIALSWIAAALLNIALSLAPPLVASVVVLAGVVASAWLLRRAAFHRPARPRPSKPHKLLKRTQRMFARGLMACALFGMVAGFSDVLTGFKFVLVPERYEILLAMGVVAAMFSDVLTGFKFVLVPERYEILLAMGVVAAMAVVLAVGLLCKHGFVTYAYRATTLLMAAGCLMTPFVFGGSFIYSNVVIFGAYTAFIAVLCVVCIDVSNYFDQPATRTFGLAFCLLYGGELAGNGLGHLMVDILGLGVAHLNLVGFVLTLTIVVANLFLFTEKDLTETSLGEMTNEEGDFEEAGAQAASATLEGHGPQTTAPGAEDRTANVSAQLVERFGLTPREADVLPLIIKGRTIARIQEELQPSAWRSASCTAESWQETAWATSWWTSWGSAWPTSTWWALCSP